MSERAERISGYLPSFYKTWVREALIRRFIDAVSTKLEEYGRLLPWLMESRWIDTASGESLDMLGRLVGIPREVGEDDEAYRERIKRNVTGFKGGGTKASIISSVAALLRAREEDISIVENPESPESLTVNVVSGDSWEMRSRGVEDSPVEITLRVRDGEGEIVGPEVECLDTGFRVKINRRVRAGEEVRVAKDGKVYLDGEPLKEVEVRGRPILPRKRSRWRYREELLPAIGVFDSGVFDESVFALKVPVVAIRFEWVRRVPAFFEVVFEERLLRESGRTVEDVRRVVSSIKACGVGFNIKVMGGE